MSNVKGTESRRYPSEELMVLAQESDERGEPPWVSRELLKQAGQDFFPRVRG